MDLSIIMLIIFIILIVAFVYYLKKRKKLDVASVCLITGGVKSGKSSLGVHLAIREYKRAYRKYIIRKYIFMKKNLEEPALCSNIPLYCPTDIWHLFKKVKYLPLTNDILDRHKRLPYGSITYCGEFSLVADSMSGSIQGTKEQKEYLTELGERLSLFIKLYGHETGGVSSKSIGPGKIICDTQALADIHWGLRRNVSSCIYIERSIKWIPFLMLFKVRELIYLDEKSVNTFDTDVEDANIKWYIAFKPFKYFDYCCYSVFTDNLDVENKKILIKKYDKKKVKKLPSFRLFKTITIDNMDTYEGSEKK